MNFDYLKITALIAVVVGFWKSIKEGILFILSFVVQKVEIKNENAQEAVVGHLVSNYKRLRIYSKIYSARHESYRSGKYGLVPFEIFGMSALVFYSEKKILKLFRLPFMFSRKKPQDSNKGNEESNVKEKANAHIYFIRGTLNIDKIITESVHDINKLNWEIDEIEKSSRFNIIYVPERSSSGKDERSNTIGFPWYRQNQFRILGVDHSLLGRDRKNDGKALENLFFPDEIKDLVNIIKLWVKSKSWYSSKKIPWKRGWLLYGPPGTGKTALARAFAEDLDMPLYFYSLPQLSNDQFIKAWQNMQLNIPCIALIEDIDNVFDQRKNICQNVLPFANFMKNEDNSNERMIIPLSFDTLLNCIDGVDKTDGIFTIITTNDLSKIDPSIGIPKILDDGSRVFISTRPGRIDTAIELTYMTKENKKQMAEKILHEFKDALSEVLAHIESDINETPAQFQEYCSKIALKEYWNSMALS